MTGTRAQVLRAYRDGASVEEIMERFGLSRRFVESALEGHTFPADEGGDYDG